MKNPPKTLKAAKRYRYGRASWVPEGIAYDKDGCAYEVTGRSGFQYQCFRKNGHGVGKLYCWQHAKKVKK